LEASLEAEIAANHSDLEDDEEEDNNKDYGDEDEDCEESVSETIGDDGSSAVDGSDGSQGQHPRKRPRLQLSIVKSATASDPASFSRVPTHLPLDQLKEDFPLYVDAMSRCRQVTVRAGEALYLPTGWFHEVFSKSSATSSEHIAFNYWFHPPDSSDYDHPYSSSFWTDDWKTRLESGNI
jgi:hypothetical protein